MLAAVYFSDGVAHDDLLLSRIRGRDREALAELYDRDASLLYSLASCILRRELNAGFEAEAVIADAFAAFWTHLASTPSRSLDARGWLVDRVRLLALARRTHFPPRDGCSTVAAHECPNALLGETIGLTALQRLAIELVFFDGYSMEQASAQSGESVAAIRAALTQGLSAWRRQAP